MLNETKFGVKPSGLPIMEKKLKVYIKANDASVQANAEQNYILDAYQNARQKNPDVPFSKLLPPLKSCMLCGAVMRLKRISRCPLKRSGKKPKKQKRR